MNIHCKNNTAVTRVTDKGHGPLVHLFGGLYIFFVLVFHKYKTYCHYFNTNKINLLLPCYHITIKGRKFGMKAIIIFLNNIT